ncbi:MAG: hypothetical protein ACJ75B_15290 [Flavisolibacter sp.]
MAVQQKASPTALSNTTNPHGLLVTNCRYDYDDIIEILKDKKYKTLILQFVANTIEQRPVFTVLSYASDGTSYLKQELKPISGTMDITKDKVAIMGNNILLLDKLRKEATDPKTKDFYKFDYVKFCPRIQDVYSGHIIYDVDLVPAPLTTSRSVPTDPCPPACPVSFG